ncbi:UDP-glucose 4-epimerase GalE [bacterium]|nr:UDP-glucose 4-epimerase GalE [bacterium]
MRVLVTGGAGYIGSHVARALVRAGHEVEALDDLSRGHREMAARAGVPLIEADVRDGNALDRVLAREWDAVVHLAALALVPESVEREKLYEEVNVVGSLALLDSMTLARVPRLIFASSAAVYGEPSTPGTREDAMRSPLNPYGRTKHVFEFVLEGLPPDAGLRWLSLRYFNVAGASDEGDLGERHDPETHLVPRLLEAAFAGEPFTVFGRDHATRDGTCVRDFVHVEDVARANVLALSRIDQASGVAINVGSGRPTTVLEAVSACERVLGKSVRIEDRPRRPGDPSVLVAHVSRAERILGFRAERSLEDAISSQARFVSLHRPP